jgi:predicted DNA-binding transcriptional regulator AlpA
MHITTWRTWDAAGRTPQALRIGPRFTRWRLDDIVAWVEWGMPRRREFEQRRKYENA